MKKRISFFAVLSVLILALALVGCFKSNSSTDSGSGAPGEEAGFEEFPIGDEMELGPLNVAGVYFQPVDMEPAGAGLAASASSFHIEADISALENDLGFGVGDFVPYLRVEYEIIHNDGPKAGKMAVSGTFMAMNATDGPHYGANVKLDKAGSYTVRFIIHSPEEQGYLLHVDALTGVKGRFWKEPLVAEWTDFQYVPRKW